MQDAEIRSVIADAATDAKRKVRVVEWSTSAGSSGARDDDGERILRGYIVRAE